jgi:hypothetical protein
MKSITREQQGELIARAKGAIKRLDDRNYIVNSQSGNGSYNIRLTEAGVVCSCPDQLYRGTKCKQTAWVKLILIYWLNHL